MSHRDDPVEAPEDRLLAELAESAADELTPLVPVRAPAAPRVRARRRTLLLLLAGLCVGGAVALALVARPWWREGVALAEAHVSLATTHPGWSFPARVDSAPVPLTARPEVLLVTAEALGYAEACPRGREPERGSYCQKTKRVTPRYGDALEPLTLGWIIGPDAELREHLPLAEAPKHLVDAIIAAEDRDFREHSGVSLMGLLRATVTNVREGGYSQGASTLTMQVVRAWNQRRERTVTRKLREAVMALAIDRHLGKDGVLQAYLDAPYLGQLRSLSVCGFQAASRHYFGKDARALSLAEAAMLAAILPAPGLLGPDRDPALTREKRDRVLRTLGTQGYDVTAALAEPIRTVPPATLSERFPAYLSAVRAALDAELPPEQVRAAGLRVTAAVDVAMQHTSEGLLRTKTQYLATLVPKSPAGPLASAGVVLDVQTGQVRAIYGGDERVSTNFNRATQARRQGGSAFKPVVYALAMSTRTPEGRPRYTAASTQPNKPRVFRTPQGDWRPRNVSGDYSDTACLAHGLAWSMNIATASLLEDLGGPGPLVGFASKLGFDTRAFPHELGLALGQAEVTPLELASFAALIARGGTRLEPEVVLSAVDARGVERWSPAPAPVEVLSPEAAALTRDLMRAVVDVGTGGAARGAGEPGYMGPMIGKTGTTDREKDLWFVGATPRYAAVVWLGYDQPAPIGAAASDLAAPLWGWWMRALTTPEGPPPAFTEGPKLSRRGLCSITGRLAGPTCYTIPASFLPGTEPRDTCLGEHEPDPVATMLAAARAGTAEAGHESLWKRLAREKAEAAAAAGP
jgi:membrane peptidoglycan carboxypeptidase